MAVQAPTRTPLSNPVHWLRSSRPRDRSPGGHRATRPALGSQRWWAWAPRERGERRGLVPLKPLPARTCAHGHAWRAVHGASAHPVPAAGGALGSRRTPACVQLTGTLPLTLSSPGRHHSPQREGLWHLALVCTSGQLSACPAPGRGGPRTTGVGMATRNPWSTYVFSAHPR